MSQTPRTDAAYFSATTEKPESGDYELCVVDVSFANALERELAELAAWKKETLLVESRWDCQRVGKLLGIQLGRDIRPNIEPKIRALLAGHSWNVEETSGGLRVCRGEHERSHDCEWVDYVPADGVRTMLADPVALRANILRHGPPGFDLYSAEHIERIKSEAVHQVEQKLNDALVENAKLWDTVKHDSNRMQAMMLQLASAGIAPPP